jgi:hypothetical protein
LQSNKNINRKTGGITMSMFNWLKKVFGKGGQVLIALTHGDIIEKASDKANAALHLFQVAHDELEAAKDALYVVARTAQVESDKLIEHIKDATEKFDAYNSVQQQLKPFISPTQFVIGKDKV